MTRSNRSSSNGSPSSARPQPAARFVPEELVTFLAAEPPAFLVALPVFFAEPLPVFLAVLVVFFAVPVVVFAARLPDRFAAAAPFPAASTGAGGNHTALVALSFATNVAPRAVHAVRSVALRYVLLDRAQPGPGSFPSGHARLRHSADAASPDVRAGRLAASVWGSTRRALAARSASLRRDP